MTGAENARQKGRKRGDRRREALTQAAAELFWTKGFAATSIADIAQKAAVPVGNVYYYYKTKSDLADAVATFFVGETESLVQAVQDETPDPRKPYITFYDNPIK